MPAFLMACAAASSAKAAELPAPLVHLSEVDASIEQDIRYASPRNFTGSPVPGYDAPECILTREAAEALRRVQTALANEGYALRVYDCYRPERAVRAFMRWVTLGKSSQETASYRPNVAQRALIAQGYIAARSTHSTGRAIDLTIVPIKPVPAKDAPEAPTAKAEPVPAPKMVAPCTAPEGERGTDGSIDMGTSYDCFDPKSHTSAAGLSAAQKAARRTLVSAMQAQGFSNYAKEWWHFTYAAGGSKSFDVPVRARRR